MSIIINLLGKADEITGRARESLSFYDEDDLLNIKLSKPEIALDVIYGVGYRVTPEGEVVITCIIPESVADWYNNTCDQELSMCAGDIIVNVNRKTEAREIVEELKNAPQVDMTLIKAGPRWHISGITAESMERIEKAIDKGLAFELTEARSMTEDDEVNLTLIHWFVLLLCIGAPNLCLMFFFSDAGFGFAVYEMFAPANRRLVGNGFIFLSCVIGVCLYIADWSTWTSKPQKIVTAVFVIYTNILGWLFKMRYYPQVPLVGCLIHVPVFIGVLRVFLLKRVRRASFYRGVTASLYFWGFFSLVIWLLWMIPGEEGRNGWAGNHAWNTPTKRTLVKDADPLYKEYKVDVSGSERRIYYEMDCDKRTKSKYVCTNNHCSSAVGINAVAQLQTELNPQQTGLYCCKRYLQAGNITSTGPLCYSQSSSPCADQVSNVDVYRLDGIPSTFCCSSGAKTNDEKEEIRDYCAKVKTVWFLVWLTPFVCFGVDCMLATFCAVNGIYLNANDASKLEKTMKQFIIMVMILLLTMWIGISIAGASMQLTGTLLAFCAAGLVVLFLWIYLEVGSRAITVGARRSRLMQQLIGLATNDWVRAICLIGLNILIPMSLLLNMANQSTRRLRGVSRSSARFTEGMLYILENLKHWNWASILIKMNWVNLLYWTLSIGVAKITSVFLSWLNEQLISINFWLVCLIFFAIGFIMFMLPPVPGIPVYMTAGIIIAKRAAKADAGIGFFGGTLIAIVLSFFLKLFACTGQYMIGFFMSKKVKIQQLVGVDKVFTKAIQMILEKRGMPIDKVSVLVGGPDWPTSVLCGILRLNLPQVILGTCPVIFVSSPVVLAGAFMAGPSDNDDTNEDNSGIWDTLTPVMLGISALAQIASAVVAVYYVQEVVSTHGDELSRPRKEHEPVAKLTRAEQEYMQAYSQILSWGSLQRSHQVTIVSSMLGLLLANFCFVFMNEASFREFKVSAKISDDFDQQGLSGNAWNLVKVPGIVGHVVFIIAALLHFGFLQWAKRAAKLQQMRNKSKMLALIADGTLATEDEEKRSLWSKAKTEKRPSGTLSGGNIMRTSGRARISASSSSVQPALQSAQAAGAPAQPALQSALAAGAIAGSAL